MNDREAKMIAKIKITAKIIAMIIFLHVLAKSTKKESSKAFIIAKAELWQSENRQKDNSVIIESFLYTYYCYFQQ